MFAGHFGLAAGVKSQEPEMPLWALMLSTQLLDVLFVPLYLAGIETTQRVPGAPAYGGLVIHANYTHSLVGALLNSAVAGVVAARFWGRRGGLVIGGVAFSHWILDLLVHRADLPILPGNVGGLPTLGLGLWAQPGLSAALEAALIVAGGVLYYRASMATPAPAAAGGASRIYYRRAALSAGITGLLLVLALASDVLGIG